MLRGRRQLLAFVMLVAVAGCGSTLDARTGEPSPTTASTVRVPVAPSNAIAAGRASASSGVVDGGATPESAAGSRPVSLTIRSTSLRLPTPTTRAVAFPVTSGFLVAGGLTASGTTGRVVLVPLNGHAASTVGRLAQPAHDAGGAELGSSMLLIGGGATTQAAWVQRVVADGRGTVSGRLPSPRADLAAVAVGAQVIVVGGGASGHADPRVLATRDGIHFRVVADLPVPVRYGAVVVVGSRVIVIGGTASSGDTSVIQSVDVGRGTATVVGRLPQTISHATALVAGGVVIVAGGRHAGRALNGVLEIDPDSFVVRAAGRLPLAESDAAAVVIDGIGYLVGGEAGRPLATVVSIAPA